MDSVLQPHEPSLFINNGSEIVIGDESNLNYNVDVSLQSFEGNFRGKCSKTMTVI
jgi:hypothetical protein